MWNNLPCCHINFWITLAVLKHRKALTVKYEINLNKMDKISFHFIANKAFVRTLSLFDAGYYIIRKTCGLWVKWKEKVEQKHLEADYKTLLHMWSSLKESCFSRHNVIMWNNTGHHLNGILTKENEKLHQPTIWLGVNY